MSGGNVREKVVASAKTADKVSFVETFFGACKYEHAKYSILLNTV